MKIRSLLEALVRWAAGVDDPEFSEPAYHRQRRRDVLRAIRLELVDLAAKRQRLDAQIARLRQRAEHAERRAVRAIAGGLDDQARFLLTRKRAAQQQLAMLAGQRDQLLVDERKLLRRERVLALRLEAFRQRQRTLLARNASNGEHLRVASAIAIASRVDQPDATWRLDESAPGKKSA